MKGKLLGLLLLASAAAFAGGPRVAIGVSIGGPAWGYYPPPPPVYVYEPAYVMDPYWDYYGPRRVWVPRYYAPRYRYYAPRYYGPANYRGYYGKGNRGRHRGWYK